MSRPVPVLPRLIFTDAEPQLAPAPAATPAELRGEDKARAEWRDLVGRFDDWTGRKE